MITGSSDYDKRKSLAFYGIVRAFTFMSIPCSTYMFLIAAIFYTGLEYVPRLSAAVGRSNAPQTAMGTGGVQPNLPFRFPERSDFIEITTRPLFAPSRRPPSKEVALAPLVAPSLQKGQLRLKGVAIAEEYRVALIERYATRELLRLVENQSVDGWRVVSIMPRTVTLKQGKIEIKLSLEDDFDTLASQESFSMSRSDAAGNVKNDDHLVMDENYMTEEEYITTDDDFGIWEDVDVRVLGEHR